MAMVSCNSETTCIPKNNRWGESWINIGNCSELHNMTIKKVNCNSCPPYTCDDRDVKNVTQKIRNCTCVPNKCKDEAGGWSRYKVTILCSVTCGSGFSEETRFCNSPPPSGDANPCEASTRAAWTQTRTKACTRPPCPVDGNWSNWTVGECLPKCGKGLQLKTRKCDNPTPQHNGKECLQRNNMTELNETVAVDCYSGKCILQITETSMTLPYGEPITGENYSVEYAIFNKTWRVGMVAFTVKPIQLENFNNIQATVKITGERGINITYNASQHVQFHFRMSLDGITSLRINKKEHHLGGYMGNTTCCPVGTGPGAGFLFHGAGHGGTGGGAWKEYGQTYNEDVLLGGSTGARVFDSDPGTGGGVLVIKSKGELTFAVDSVLTASGYNVPKTHSLSCSGGSSGGYIYLHAKKIAIKGTIRVNGGSGGWSHNTSSFCGDGGSGGIIKINALSLSIAKFADLSVAGGNGSNPGSAGSIIIGTEFMWDLNINTTSCTLQSSTFQDTVCKGKLLPRPNNVEICTFTFKNRLRIARNTNVTTTGIHGLSIKVLDGDFVLESNLVIGYKQGFHLKGDTFLGGYHSKGIDKGPGAYDRYAAHGNTTDSKRYGVEHFMWKGGSTCTEYISTTSVGGGVLEIKVDDGNLQLGANIHADAFSKLSSGKDVCGSSGGTIWIKADLIKFMTEDATITARGVEGSSWAGDGGVIVLVGNITTNFTTLETYRQTHINLTGGKLGKDGYIYDFQNPYLFPTKSPTTGPVTEIITSTTTDRNKNSTITPPSHTHFSRTVVTSSIQPTQVPVRKEFKDLEKANLTKQNFYNVTEQLHTVSKTFTHTSKLEEDILVKVFTQLTASFAKYGGLTQINELVMISDILLTHQIEHSIRKVDEIAAVLSQALEEMGTRIDITLLRNKSISVKTTRTEFEVSLVHVGNRTRKEFPHTCHSRDACDHVTLPDDFLDSLNNSASITTVCLNVSHVGNTQKKKTNITSNVFSIKFNIPVPSKFQTPVAIHQLVYDQTAIKRGASLWYWKENGSMGSWENDGLVSKNKTNTSIITHSYHLTSFALLVQINEFEIPVIHQRVLSIITYIGCGFSLFAFLLTFGTLLSIQTLSSDRTIIHMNLVVALGIGQVIFLTGVDNTENTPVCQMVAVLLHYFFTAAFGWMLAEGIHLYAKVVNVFQDGRSRMKFYYCIGWGSPAIVVALSAAVKSNGYGTKHACWISTDDGFIWAFITPVLLIICINLIVMCAVLRVLISSVAAPTELSNNKTKEQIRAALKAMVILMPILGTTWLLGMFAVNEETIAFQYIFAILNSLQGVFIFMFYCVLNREVRAALKRLHEKHTSTKGLSKSTGDTSINGDFKERGGKKGKKTSIQEAQSELFTKGTAEDLSNRYALTPC